MATLVSSVKDESLCRAQANRATILSANTKDKNFSKSDIFIRYLFNHLKKSKPVYLYKMCSLRLRVDT